MTEAMPFLQKAILLSYAPAISGGGFAMEIEISEDIFYMQ